MKTRRLISTCLFIVLLAATNFSFGQNTSSNAVIFFKIDNQAIVTVDGETVYDSGIVGDNPELNTEVDLTTYLITGNETVAVSLINTPCKDCLSNPWTISYEIIKDNESVDYIYEDGAGGVDGGEEFFAEYAWEDLY